MVRSTTASPNLASLPMIPPGRRDVRSGSALAPARVPSPLRYLFCWFRHSLLRLGVGEVVGRRGLHTLETERDLPLDWQVDPRSVLRLIADNAKRIFATFNSFDLLQQCPAIHKDALVALGEVFRGVVGDVA